MVVFTRTKDLSLLRGLGGLACGFLNSEILFVKLPSLFFLDASSLLTGIIPVNNCLAVFVGTDSDGEDRQRVTDSFFPGFGYNTRFPAADTRIMVMWDCLQRKPLYHVPDIIGRDLCP